MDWSWTCIKYILSEFSDKQKMDNSTNFSKLSLDETAEEASEDNCLKWDLPLLEIYKLSLKFFKGLAAKNYKF